MATKQTRYTDGSQHTDGAMYVETVPDLPPLPVWRKEKTVVRGWTKEEPVATEVGEDDDA